MATRFDPLTSPSIEEWRHLYREHVATLRGGYDKALAAAGFDAVVLHSGTPRKRSEYDDQDWPLRPTPHFAHWLPLAVPDCALVVSGGGGKPRLFHNTASTYWETAPPALGELYAGEFDVVASDDVARMKEIIRPGKKLAFVGEDAARGEALGIPRATHNPRTLVTALDALRLVKSTYELRCIAEANRRAARGHHAIRQAFEAGESSELALHLEYLRASEQYAYETPYQDIVAIGENAATLHHVHYRRERDPRPALSLLVDAGAAHQGYASDITRTYVRGDAPRFAEFLHRMEALQQDVLTEVRVGTPWEQVHDGAHRKLGRVCVDMDLVSCTADTAVESGITRKLLPHGLGHSLGVQVHDVGSRTSEPRAENPYLRTTVSLSPGHVVTVEPGCYFIAPLLEALRASPAGRDVRWEALRELVPFGGVRIEDDVAVLDGGALNLTRPFVP